MQDHFQGTVCANAQPPIGLLPVDRGHIEPHVSWSDPQLNLNHEGLRIFGASATCEEMTPYLSMINCGIDKDIYYRWSEVLRNFNTVPATLTIAIRPYRNAG